MEITTNNKKAALLWYLCKYNLEKYNVDFDIDNWDIFPDTLYFDTDSVKI